MRPPRPAGPRPAGRGRAPPGAGWALGRRVLRGPAVRAGGREAGAPAAERAERAEQADVARALGALARGAGRGAGADRAAAAREVAGLEEAAVAALPAMDVAEVSRVLHAYVRLGVKPRHAQFYLASEAAVVARAMRADPTALARVVWSMGKLDRKPLRRVVDALLRGFTRPGGGRPSAKDVANVYWGLGKLKYCQGAETAGALDALMVDQLASLTSQGLCHVLWMYQQTQARPPEAVLAAVVGEVERRARAGSLRAWEMALAADALADLRGGGGGGREVLQAAPARAALERQRVPELRARAKALGVRGFSRMRKADLVAALLDREGAAAGAAAEVPAPAEPLALAAALKAAVKDGEAVDARGSVQALRALVRLGQADDEVVALLVASIEAQMDGVSAKSLSQAVKALRLARHKPPPRFLDSVRRRALAQKDFFSEQRLLDLMDGFAYWKEHCGGELLDHFNGKMLRY